MPKLLRFELLRAPESGAGTGADSSPPAEPVGDGDQVTSTAVVDNGSAIESDDFAALAFDNEDETQAGDPPAPEGAPAASDPPASETPPAEPKKVEPAQPEAAPAKAPEAPKADAAPAPSETAPAASPEAGQKSIVQQIDEGREAIIGELAKGRFALSEEEAAAFDTGDPREIVPRLLAKAYVESARTMMVTLEQFVPQVVSHVLTAREAQSTAEKEFFSPERADLAPHRAKVLELGQTLRRLHPEMPRAEFIPLLETTARVHLGLHKAAQPAAAPAPTRAGAFQPVTTSAAPVVAAQPQRVDEWDFYATAPDE